MKECNTYQEFCDYAGENGIGLIEPMIMDPDDFTCQLRQFISEFGTWGGWLAYCAWKKVHVECESDCVALKEAVLIWKELLPKLNAKPAEELKLILRRFDGWLAWSGVAKHSKSLYHRRGRWQPYPGKLSNQDKMDLANFLMQMGINEYAKNDEGHGTVATTDIVGFTQCARIMEEDFIPWYKKYACKPR